MKLAMTLAVAIAVVKFPCLAQQNAGSPPNTPNAAAAAAETNTIPAAPRTGGATNVSPAASSSSAATNATTRAAEVLEEIHIEDAPLAEVIKFLANEAELQVTIDERIISGHVGPDGQPIPPPNISVNLTNVTARQALEQVLSQHKLAMIPDPNTKSNLITEVPVEMKSPVISVATNAPAGEALLPVITIGEQPVLDVVSMLADAAKIDIIIDPKLVQGTNSISTNSIPAMKFYNKTYRQALDAILSNNDLALVPDPKTQIARVTRKPPPELEPLVTQVIQLRYANVTNMVTLIQTTMPTPTRSRVASDPRTSQLIVIATQRDIDAITNLVTQLDTPTKQVLIEARLLETTKNPRTIKGIDWSGTLEAQTFRFGNGITTGNTITRTPGAATTVTLPSGRTISRTEGSSAATDLNTVLGAAGISADTLRGFYPPTAFLNADGVRAVLSFLNSESDTKTLATPRAVTLDNEPARLEVSRAFPIFQNTPGSANVPASAQVQYTNLGTILTVTPRIAANSNISLTVVPEVSDIDRKETQFINGQENTANVYVIRKISTRVMIPSGSTLVMGGLISDKTTKTYSKIPLLGDIPGIGLLFRHDSKDRSKGNLLVFITPTIIGTNDFQPSETKFLQTTPPGDELEPEPSAWDRGKPHSWRKKKQADD